MTPTDSFTDLDGTVRLRGTYASGGIGRARLTAAQVLDLDNTPVAVLDPPGAGYAWLPLAVQVAYIAGATPYTDNGGLLSFAVSTDLSQPWLARTLNGVATAAGDTTMAAYADAWAVAASDLENAGIVCFYPADPLTAGDGELIVRVLAQALPVS